MEPITNNEFLNSVLEAEAWKEISNNESLSMDILDKVVGITFYSITHHIISIAGLINLRCAIKPSQSFGEISNGA